MATTVINTNLKLSPSSLDVLRVFVHIRATWEIHLDKDVAAIMEPCPSSVYFALTLQGFPKQFLHVPWWGGRWNPDLIFGLNDFLQTIELQVVVWGYWTKHTNSRMQNAEIVSPIKSLSIKIRLVCQCWEFKWFYLIIYWYTYKIILAYFRKRKLVQKLPFSFFFLFFF